MTVQYVCPYSDFHDSFLSDILFMTHLFTFLAHYLAAFFLLLCKGKLCESGLPRKGVAEEWTAHVKAKLQQTY